MFKLVFKTMPLGTNNLYLNVRHGRILSPKARANKEAIGWEARTQYRGYPLTTPLKVTVALYWPTRANHDIDNIKVLLDSLTGIVWKDDGQIVDLHITKQYRKGMPGVSMTVEELSTPQDA